MLRNIQYTTYHKPKMSWHDYYDAKHVDTKDITIIGNRFIFIVSDKLFMGHIGDELFKETLLCDTNLKLADPYYTRSN